jgi:cytochrome c peroxidase
MGRIATLGQKLEKMVDCSEVIPEPKPRVGKPHLPAGCSLDEIEQSVRAQV